MFEKGNLSFWDIGTYLIIGCFASIIIGFYTLYGFEIKFPSWAKNLKDYSASMVIIAPILFLLLGMFIEPIANWFAKQIEKLGWFKPRESRNKEKLTSIIINKLSDDELKSINQYRFCKAVVELKFPSSNHVIFLARFGFYRSLSFIMLILFVLNWFVFQCDLALLLTNGLVGFLSYLFLKRSQIFKNHMEDAVYYNFLALVTTEKTE